jgi:hypothetical protein
MRLLSVLSLIISLNMSCFASISINMDEISPLKTQMGRNYSLWPRDLLVQRSATLSQDVVEIEKGLNTLGDLETGSLLKTAVYEEKMSFRMRLVGRLLGYVGPVATGISVIPGIGVPYWGTILIAVGTLVGTSITHIAADLLGDAHKNRDEVKTREDDAVSDLNAVTERIKQIDQEKAIQDAHQASAQTTATTILKAIYPEAASSLTPNSSGQPSPQNVEVAKALKTLYRTVAGKPQPSEDTPHDVPLVSDDSLKGKGEVNSSSLPAAVSVVTALAVPPPAPPAKSAPREKKGFKKVPAKKSPGAQSQPSSASPPISPPAEDKGLAKADVKDADLREGKK